MRVRVTAALFASLLVIPLGLPSGPTRHAAAGDPPPAPGPAAGSEPVAPPAPAPAPTAPLPAASAPSEYESLFPFGPRGVKPDPAKTVGGAGRLAAIEAGVRWLVAHQTSTGAWDPSDIAWCDGQKATLKVDGPGKQMYTVALTGMALSALLGAGATDRGAQPVSRAVASGLAFLRGKQDDEGCLVERQFGHYVYCHAFGTLALVEAFGATGDAGLRQAAQKALDFIALARNPTAAWRYGVKPGENDTSLTGCMSMPVFAAMAANEAAEMAGRDAPFVIDEDIFPGARAWIDAMTDSTSGRLGYVQKGTGPARPADFVAKFPAEKSESVTAIGMVVRQRMPGGDPERDAEMIRLGAKLLSELPPAWTPGNGNIDLYYWYYGALAMQRLGGDVGDAWLHSLVDALVKGQRKDGDVCTYKGSWDDADCWGPDGGRLYSTAIAVLSLETPSRFPRLAPGRPDLVDALQAKDTPPVLQAQLLGAISLYRPGGAEKALIPYARSMEPEVRAAGAAAMARSKPSPFGVQVLGSMLTDLDARVRRAAILALESLGADAAPAVAPVAAAIKDADPVVRAGAAAVLSAAGPAAQGFAGALKPLLADPDAGVRVSAAVAYFRLAQDAAVSEPVLLEGLKSEDLATRAAAARGLGAIGPAATHAAAALRPFLDDAPPRLAIEAANALWSLKYAEPRLVARVESSLADPDPEVRAIALKLAEAMGPDATAAAPKVGTAALRGARSQREQAVRTLAAIGKGAISAAPAIYACRDPRSPSLRALADDALARLAFAPGDLLPVLTKGLESTDDRWARGSTAGFEALGKAGAVALLGILDRPDATEPLRRRAIVALGVVGPEADVAVDSLVRLLESEKSAELRLEAVRALGSIGPRAVAAADALVKRLDDVDPRVPAAAVWALGRMAVGAPDAILALARVLERKGKGHESVRIAAAETIGGLGAAALPAVSALTGCFPEEEPTVPAAAVQALGRLGKIVVDALRDKLKIATPRVRGRSAQALAAIGPDAKTAIPELTAVFEDPLSGVQQDVANAFVHMGKPGIKPLIGALKHKSPLVREPAARALGEFGKDGQVAIGPLTPLLKDPDSNVANAAQASLAKLKAK